jgi:hypothetical protein
MTKTLRTLALATPFVLLAACGGTSPSATSHPATVAELAAATPAMSSVALADGPEDSADSWSNQFTASLSAQIHGDMEHPHLFLRAGEVVGRVNRHIFKFLAHLEDAILSKPALTTGDSATWTKTKHGFEATLTVQKAADTVYAFTLGLAPVTAPGVTVVVTPVTVAAGTVNTAGAAGPHQGKGDLSFDLDAYGTVTGTEVAGTIDAHFDNLADHRLVSVHAVGVVWDSDSHDRWRDHSRAAPRSADYVSYRQKGVGGSLKVTEEAAFSCSADPSVATAQVGLVNRWYITPEKSVHGRTDAEFTSPLLEKASVAKVVALTCHQSATAKDVPAEGEWLLKAEDKDGATVWGWAAVHGTTPCDPALGDTVPSLTDAKTDFDFSKVSYTDGTPYPFPGYKAP